MAGNESLHKASVAKQDEFYTQISDIERELVHYEEHFRDKVVFCNCDDPAYSNFWRYFQLKFYQLGLKKLISTHYDANAPSYKMEIVRKERGEQLGIPDYVQTPLKQNGDFRSEECIEILKEADIVVTNPPFSLFREYLTQLIEYGKKFVIIAPLNCVTYKEVFPLFKENKIWCGYGFMGGNAYFATDPKHEYASGVYDSKTGLVKFRNVLWVTNLDIPKRHEELPLIKKYYGHEEEYPKYDNYDAINVNKIADIPCDYFEDLGVPITFLDKHNPDQFEIVKFRKGNDEKDLTYTIGSDYNPNGTERNGTERNGTERNGTERNGTERNGELRLTSGSSSVARCNGVMGVPITFLDKYNPDQFSILGIDRYIEDNPNYGRRFTVGGKEIYARILVRRKM